MTLRFGSARRRMHAKARPKAQTQSVLLSVLQRRCQRRKQQHPPGPEARPLRDPPRQE